MHRRANPDEKNLPVDLSAGLVVYCGRAEQVTRLRGVMNTPGNGDENVRQDDMYPWRELVRLDPSSPALLPLVRRHLDENRADLALGVVEPVLRSHPSDLEAGVLTARALVELDRLDEARELLGSTRKNLEKLAENFADLERLFARTGDEETAARLTGAHLALSGRLQEPQAAPFAEAEDESPETSEPEAFPSETLAALYLGQGHLNKAVAVLRQLLNQDPENEDLAQKLAELENRTGAVLKPGMEAEQAVEEQDGEAIEETALSEAALSRPALSGMEDTLRLQVPSDESPEAAETGQIDHRRMIASKIERLRQAAARRREAVELSS